MFGYASDLWDFVVPDLAATGILRLVDTPMLQSMCELWGLYRQSYEMLVMEPADKDARNATLAYWTQFKDAASKCGLSPADRERLHVRSNKPDIGIHARAR